LYGEAFGLYLLEAWGTGLPAVQPRHAAFPELIESTGGGVLCEPGSPEALANGLEPLLLDTQKAFALGKAGRTSVLRQFGMEQMAERVLQVFHKTLGKQSGNE
jgi:glycosyltransferase involved in cell wall biosynthesis